MRSPAEIRAKTPMEAITRTDFLLMAFNSERAIRERKHFVDLACGHKAYTSAIGKCVCPRCTEMFNRSLQDGSEDYEGFRRGEVRDEMTWPNDPCRQFNEPTDLAGRFLRDP